MFGSSCLVSFISLDKKVQNRLFSCVCLVQFDIATIANYFQLSLKSTVSDEKKLVSR